MSYQTNQTWYAQINFDKSDQYINCDFSLGYGKYRVDFYVSSIKTFTCDIDFSDANFTGTTIPNQYIQQFLIEYRDNGTVWAKFNDPNASYSQISNEGVFEVWKQLGTNYGEQPRSRGNFTDSQDPNSQYHSFPLDATTFGHFAHDVPEEVYLNLKVTNFNANIITGKTITVMGSTFKLDDGKVLTIYGGQNNKEMVVSGEGAKFESGNNSQVIFPENYSLKIIEGAAITALGTKFQPSPQSPVWKGINLSGPGHSIIDGCVFNNAEKSIRSTNCGSNFINISNNVFNVNSHNYPDTPYFGIVVYNGKSLLLYNNDFILPNDNCENATGIGIYNYAQTEEENNDAPQVSINITDNIFYGGNAHIIVSSLSESYITANIMSNTFYNSPVNLFLINSGGFVKGNEFNNTGTYECSQGETYCNIFLHNNKSDFLENIISGNYDNFYMKTNSVINFAPYQISEFEFFWKAGKNIFISKNNLNFNAPEEDYRVYFYTNLGRNFFNSSGYHIYGLLNTEESSYKVTNNCWMDGENITNPICYLENNNHEMMELIYQPVNCNPWNEQVTDFIINGTGNGVYDTLLITQSNNAPTLSNDELLYSLSEKNKTLKNFSPSIINNKNLINSFPDSKRLESAIYNLYECYVSSDTNHNQSWRNVLFGDLKNYLEDKMQVHQNNEVFVSVAYDFILKCSIKKKEYQYALEGYEFIAENSPYAVERFMASLNYIDVNGLIQGSGGGQKENTESPQISKKDTNLKPIREILTAAYNKTKKAFELNENVALQNSNDKGKTKLELEKKHRANKELENKAFFNLSISGSLSKEERREKIQKDLKLLTSINTNNGKSAQTNDIKPNNYELCQNYPNPFNPVTRINYTIQNQGAVLLRIYDITGREIKTLVNEVKSPGKYTVDFNGSNLASGVYFYKLEINGYRETKRMLLLK